MFERFTEKAIKVVMLSQEESRRLGHNFVGTEQILLGLVGENGGVAYKVLRTFGVTLREARTEVERIIGRGSGFVAVEIPFTPRAKRVLEIAIEEARDLGHGYIGTEHILLALLEEEVGVGVRVLQQLGLVISQIRTELLIQIGENIEAVAPGDKSDQFDMGGLAIEEFTTNLTETAYNGNLDPVVGRDDEISRVIQILARRRKNNPVLIGEPGVGKTAVAEGLAQRIVERDVPALLDDKQVISLDVGLLLAGTKYRGEFEERLKRIVDEIRSSENIILVIDEVHTLIGAGAAEGAVDAANILKPALARGELQCLGATTVEEYRKHIERDSALERRFQPVQVPEPSVDDTVDILRCLRARYERHHGLKIGDDALEAASRMGAQYIADRFLPDKAIDLIDEACARVRLRATRTPDSATGLKRELRDVMKEKETAIREQEVEGAAVIVVREQDFERAADILDREIEIRAQLNIILSTVKRVSSSKETPTYESIVCEDDIAHVVAAWTGIPVNKLSKTESEKLLVMEDTLHSRIIGQEQAVSAVSKAIRRARVGLRNPNRPIASFLFSGPTGVGKTELTKALALFFFGAEDSMVRLDMSEYMERHTVAKLIGSPPGYVGYSEGGQLTEAVRRKPYTVVLFDEIEKGHPDVFNLLLQILEDGRLTDSKGRTIDFKNTMIILTSNVGAKAIQNAAGSGSGLGFDSPDTNDEDSEYTRMAELVNEELKRFFRPEFLNRLDEVIIFQQLTKRDLGQIADIMLAQLCARTKDQNFTLNVTPRAKDLLIDEGFDPIYGARPLRRAIMKLLEDKLAQTVLSESIEPDSLVLVDVNDNRELSIVVDHSSIPLLEPVTT
jgi:ATP-dependent Clp protease ATP-binding subunit ClpC